jgi:hypothetical protein
VEVRRDGRRFEAEALLDLEADTQTVWQTITDYPALPAFMPDLHRCQVVERQAGADGAEHLVVEQSGVFRFLMFALSIEVLLHIEHHAPRLAQATAARLDLGLIKPSPVQSFVGRYELQPAADVEGRTRTQLHYSASIGLRLPPPPSVGSVVVRHNLAAQLRALAGEVALRQARAGR